MGLGVELIEGIEHHTPVLAAHSRRVVDVQHGVADRPQRHAGVAGREVSTAPHAGEKGLGIRLGGPIWGQHDKRGQLVVLTAQPVGEPGTQTRFARHLAAGHDEGASRIMIDGIGLNRLEHRQFVDDLGRVREQFADPAPTLAGLIELEHGRCHRKASLTRGHGGDALTIADRIRQILVEILLQLRLVVPEIELGRSPVHVQVNEPLGLRRKVRESGQRGMNAGNSRGRRSEQLAGPECRQCQTAQADTRIAEELTPGLIQLEF